MCYIHTDTAEHENKMKYGIKTQGKPLTFRAENFSRARYIDIANAHRCSFNVKRRRND
jgi:hypothetical protein